MLTFTDQQNIAQEISGLTDATNVTKFKRDINTGGTLFMASLGRDYNEKRRTTDSVAAQQFYQYPEDAVRVHEVIYHSTTTFNPPLIQVADENTWAYMNQTAIQGMPTHYFVRGFDEIGLYPTPSSSVTDGIEIRFEPKHVLLTDADYTTGTLTVTNGSTTITGSGTVFTANMAGRWLQVTDGTDGNWYRIASYSSATSLTLDNYYQGISGSGRTYRIGQVMDLPEEYQEAPVDYAMYRHFVSKGDLKTGSEFKAMFDNAKERATSQYAQKTSNNVIYANNRVRLYDPLRDTPQNF